MSRDRVAFLVYLDLDPVPGEMHSTESAANALRSVIMNTGLMNYRPTIGLAPESIQPSSPETLADYTDTDAGTSMDARAFLAKYNIEGPTTA